MTDAQGALLEPLRPPPGTTGGRGGRLEKHPRRRVLDAIFSVVRGGIAGAAPPAEVPPATTVSGIFRRWVRAGAGTRLPDARRDRARRAAGRHPLPTAAVSDSASVRGADTVPARSRGYDAGRLVRWATAVPAVTVTLVERTEDRAGFRVIPRRWVVERTLAWISKHRRCVRDYETRPEHAEAMVYIAMIMTMSRRLAR